MAAWAGDPLYTFGERNPEMEQAIVEARITLPKFLSAVTQPDNSLHPLRKPVNGAYGAEFFTLH